MQPEDFDPRRHNYFADVLKVDLTPGAVNYLTVLHDEWCAFFDGGYCDCNPEIVRRPLEVTP